MKYAKIGWTWSRTAAQHWSSFFPRWHSCNSWWKDWLPCQEPSSATRTKTSQPLGFALCHSNKKNESLIRKCMVCVSINSLFFPTHFYSVCIFVSIMSFICLQSEFRIQQNPQTNALDGSMAHLSTCNDLATRPATQRPSKLRKAIWAASLRGGQLLGELEPWFPWFPSKKYHTKYTKYGNIWKNTQIW